MKTINIIQSNCGIITKVETYVIKPNIDNEKEIMDIIYSRFKFLINDNGFDNSDGDIEEFVDDMSYDNNNGYSVTIVKSTEVFSFTK